MPLRGVGVVLTALGARWFLEENEEKELEKKWKMINCMCVHVVKLPCT